MSSLEITSHGDPHRATPREEAGQPLSSARYAMLLLHGRGATAEGMLSLGDELPHREYAYVAPQADDQSWYPQRFLAPIEANEPYLSSALRRIEAELARFEAAGIPAERTVLLGFSQGACLAAEYAARNPRRYRAVAALSGALIGAANQPREEPAAVLARTGGRGLAGTPFLLGCSDRDPHIPEDRVRLSAAIVRELGAEVTLEIYPGLGHTINEPELQWIRSRMA